MGGSRGDRHEEVSGSADVRCARATERVDRHEQGAARKLAHARILLKADQADGGPGGTDERIAEALDVRVATIERVRQQFVADGLDTALCRKKPEKPNRQRTLDGRAEARLVAVACSPPPDDRKRWTMQMLADQLVALEVVGAVSDETVRRTLPKTRSSRG